MTVAIATSLIAGSSVYAQDNYSAVNNDNSIKTEQTQQILFYYH
jgi:hypothetical protein